MEDEEKTEKVSWSMDLSQLQKISSLLDSADVFYLAFDYGKVADVLRTLKFEIVHSLSDVERAELLQMEKVMSFSIVCFDYETFRLQRGCYPFDSSEIDSRLNDMIPKVSKSCKGLVEKYRVKIMDLLNKYGYLQKNKKDNTQLGG